VKDSYGLDGIEHIVRDARYMVEHTERGHWGASMLYQARGAYADEHFAAWRVRLIDALRDLVISEDEHGVVLSNGRHELRFDIGREYVGDRRPTTEPLVLPSDGPVRYRTDYSNEVHQLMVSVSRHLWVAKDGAIRYQQKPFEITLARLARSEKQHVIHYLVRDHFSGLLYAEIGLSGSLLSPREFLLRAWSRKDRLSFCGVPDTLIVPKTVSDTFAELLPWLDELEMDVIPATSGFQAGVRDVKTWEEAVRNALRWFPADDLAHLPALAEMLCWDLVEEPLHHRQQVGRWQSGLGTLRYPTANDTPLRLIPEEWRRRVHDQYFGWLHALSDRYADGE
jgi:hypothetical protein